MDSLVEDSDTLSQSLSLQFSKILEVCGRLEIWAAAPAPPDSPLIDLAKEYVDITAKKARRLLRDITLDEPCIKHLDDDYAVLRFLNEVNLAITILVLCSNAAVKTTGDDGAINAAYASLFLPDHPNELPKNEVLYDRVKTIRLVCNFADMLSPFFGPKATSVNWWWGLPGAPKPTPDTGKHLWAVLDDFADHYTRSFLPRYVHLYSTSDIVPYTVDKNTPQASGSFGVVRKVLGRDTNECYAAKSFKVISGRARQKVLRELGCLELCIHDNLIALVEAYEVQDNPQMITLVMKPWASYTLWDFLSDSDAERQGVCPWFKTSDLDSDRHIYDIMSGIAAAIEFLHKRSIKHKDIKPQNILLHQEAGHVRPIVTDVGETKVYRRGEPTNPMASSYQYLSPEQQMDAGEMRSTLKADIWQLGCCFAMLLAVARCAGAGLTKLWTSFENTDENCSCNIANESEHFMATLEQICLPGNALQEHAHQIVVRMLEKDPMTRLDIKSVNQELHFLLH